MLIFLPNARLVVLLVETVLFWREVSLKKWQGLDTGWYRIERLRIERICTDRKSIEIRLTATEGHIDMK